MREEYENLIARVSEVAEEAFWREVADQLSEHTNSGDLEPGTSFRFSNHCKQVISEWFALNGKTSF